MEQARTSELGYVFMGEALEMRLTVFRSEVGDMIVVRENEYRNLAEARSRGAEIEISGKRFGVLDVDAAVSFISAKDASTGRTVPGSSRWLGNVGVQYPFRRDYTLALWYRYAGKRYRAPDDDRPALKARGRLDGSVSVDRFLMNGLTLRLGVRNLLNEDLRTPSAFGGYPDDYPEAGREWWIQATMTF